MPCFYNFGYTQTKLKQVSFCRKFSIYELQISFSYVIFGNLGIMTVLTLRQVFLFFLWILGRYHKLKNQGETRWDRQQQ